MKTYILECEQIIPLSRSKTFAFFSDAMNLERITPPLLRFRVITPSSVEMKTGTLLEYKLKLFGIPFRWLTLIEHWSPEESFVDTQLTGPYALWHHTHTFEEVASDKTLMRDRVLYRLPYGIFGRLAHALFVKRTLKSIFDYRAETVAKLLTPANPELEELLVSQSKDASTRKPVQTIMRGVTS